MQENIISTIVQRNIQYISDIKDIPWETDKYQKENKDDNNQYTYRSNNTKTHIITVFTYMYAYSFTHCPNVVDATDLYNVDSTFVL